MKTTNRVLPAAALALTLTVAACASSGTTASTSTATATGTASAATGTETMAGTVTGKAAVTGNNGPTVPLTLTGPVATTSTFTPPNGNGTKATITFKTPHDGNLVVDATAPDANATPAVNPKTCFFSQTVHATYVVNGAKSTGTFAEASGSGKATFYFSADGPKLASGKCNTSDNAQPLSKGAIDTFTASGPLTVKS
jgi:hypothetical protein